MEIVGPKWRAFAGQMNHIYYSMGCISASILSYYFRDWIAFTFAAVIINVPMLFFWFVIPESPRWLFLKKRNEEAVVAVRKLVGKSAKNIPRTFYKNLEDSKPSEVVEATIGSMGSIYSYKTEARGSRADVMGSIYSSKTEASPFVSNENSIKDMLRFPRIRRATIIIFFSFFVIAMVYMGISYNAAELPGSLWMNNGINGILDAFAQLLGILILQKVGRKTMLFWTLFLTGVTYFGSEMILLLQNGTDRSENNIQIIQQASLWMAFTGKFFISGSFSVIYTYTAELFPTTVRTIGLGIGSLGGGLGGVIAPYVLALQSPPISIKWLPATIFSTSCVLTAFLLLLLPETQGQPLYESMECAERAWSASNQSEVKYTQAKQDNTVGKENNLKA